MPYFVLVLGLGVILYGIAELVYFMFLYITITMKNCPQFVSILTFPTMGMKMYVMCDQLNLGVTKPLNPLPVQIG